MEVAACVHIVEDDDAVRDSLQMMLDSIGRATKTFDSADSFSEDSDKNESDEFSEQRIAWKFEIF